MMFNISNHPCHAERTTWSPEQIEAARELCGDGIIDIPFPSVTPDMTNEQLMSIAREVARDIAGQIGIKRFVKGACGCMVAGQFQLTFAIVSELQKLGIPCYTGDSIRVAEEVVQPDGSVAVVHHFKFAGFREYMPCIVGQDAIAETIAFG